MRGFPRFGRPKKSLRERLLDCRPRFTHKDP